MITTMTTGPTINPQRLVFYLAVLTGSLAASEDAMFRKRQDVAPRTMLVHSDHSRSQNECAVWCSARSDCVTFTFRPGIQECSLYALETGGIVLFSENSTCLTSEVCYNMVLYYALKCDSQSEPCIWVI